ncbi:CotO family spore coat protein [Virgibacillus senegalensis]|uniref:CotO family spore coat protein n=1 Tax=Virgibacillus senegalensis TaxID=1499679 RepID=UPI00069E056C|nr:CotO family spore coat protein [Virgibacillus senegalensis]
MSGKKNNAREPMLYITQPKMEKPAASMQTNYRTPRRKKRKPDRGSTAKEKELIKQSDEQKAEEKDKQASKHSVEGTEVEAEKTEDQVKPVTASGKETEEKETSVSPRTSRKRFRDMTNKEKVLYFVGLPRTVPRMKCEVVTETETHRGVIYDYQEGTVFMKTMKRPFKAQFDLETIQNIKLLGF